jgi:lipopolysaccharide export system protein LptA
MGRFIRRVALLAVLPTGVGAVWVLHHSAVLAQVALSRPPSVSLQETRIVLRQRGEKLADVYAAQVDVSPDGQHATFTGGPTGDFFDNGRLALRLHADEIVLDRQTHDLAARGHIAITSSQGDRVVGSAARWDATTQRLVLSGDVRVALGRNEAHAARLMVDTGLQTFDLEGRVDVRFLLGRPSP